MSINLKQILIVEDKPDTILNITTFLKHGFDCDIAANIDEALSLCEKKKYDFLLLDWVVPNDSISPPLSENGRSFLCKFKGMKQFSNTPFIVFTSHSVVIPAKETKYSGLVGVYSKNNVKDLMCEMRKILKPNIFIIHGHNALLLEKVKSHLKNGDLTPIVLSEIHDGNTVISSFENVAETCAAAIALITKDDKHLLEDGKFEWSGRHNVFIEIGWFINHFTKGRTILILEKDAEMPSDLNGVKYHSYSEGNDTVFSDITKRLNAFHLINT